MSTMVLSAMASYLRALHVHPGPELAPLPLQACAAALGLDGLGFLLAPAQGPVELVQSFGPRTLALEDLQLTQGQGPSLDAARDGTLLLLPDLSDPTATAATRWPTLPGAIQDLGIAAVFAFPVRIGVITLGALTGHRTSPGPLSADRLADTFALTTTLAQVIIDQAARPGAMSGLLLDEPGLHFAEVHQATGMLSTQLDITCAQALVLLRAHAFSQNRSILACARDILHHRLQLKKDGSRDDGT
ncbi:ANTAR domain-containing protein [Streptomyces sp. NPDC057621]|uniref:ANTAR domain-containing protein n=1 Tax=Streptomyces sp. NPDC057621 TaxID=3346186 RepID=UPI0036953C86